MPELYKHYEEVRGLIDEACRRAGRDPAEVRLLAVSKTKPLGMLEELLSCGVCAFGENKVQELCEKYDALAACSTLPKAEFHMIGHLQRNKVKYLEAREIALIHSVDSLRLAEEINKEAGKHGRVQPVLLEINIGAEASKSGAAPEEAVSLARQINGLPNLKLAGLMCVAPAADDPEQVRPCFARMRALRDEIGAFAPDCTELSMGMSGDFEAAVEEGATLVRVGSAIFGARNYA